MAHIPDGYADRAEVRVAVHSPAGEPQGEIISDFKFNRNTGYFHAQVMDGSGQSYMATGVAMIYIEAPVTRHKILQGAIIGASDVELTSVPLSRLNGFGLADYADVVGKEARRMIAAGRLIPAQSVAEPLLIAKGERVKIVYRSGKLNLEATGRAMQAGARGETIRVTNLNTNKQLSAEVADKGIVEIAE